MRDEREAAVLIRDGAHRVEIYNEALRVYLYDACHREAIVAADGLALVDLVSVDAASKDPRLASFARSGMLVFYELEQDDAIFVDVLVGSPPTSKELQLARGLKWKKPQVARIVLPSGTLWIDSADSCRINPDEEPQERGGEVSVPPGEYVLTLHRVDWDRSNDDLWEGDDEDSYYRGPHEVITLTPVAEMKVPKRARWALTLQDRVDMSWVGNYTIADGVFDGKVNFWSPWEFFKINFDTAAFTRMDLAFGSLLQMHVALPPHRFVIAFMGDEWKPSSLSTQAVLCGYDAVTLPLASEPEVAYAFFDTQRKDEMSRSDILMCMRVKAGTAIANANLDRWKKARLELLPRRLERMDRSQFGNWTREGDAVHGKVLLRTPRYLSGSFDAGALSAIDAKPGDTLVLQAGDVTRKVQLFTDSKAWLASQHRFTGPGVKEWDDLLAAQLHAVSSEEEAEVRERMRAYLLAGRPPLSAYLTTHWLEKDCPILFFRPSQCDWPQQKLTFEIDLETPLGSKLTLSRLNSMAAEYRDIVD